MLSITLYKFNICKYLLIGCINIINIFLQYFLIDFVSKITLYIRCAMCFMALV